MPIGKHYDLDTDVTLANNSDNTIASQKATKAYIDNNYIPASAMEEAATVAKTGDYNDLINKPTIPTVNNATLTIQKNGTTVNTFSANASSNVTVNITVPTTAADVNAVAANTTITGATKCKITYDSKGLVTAGANLSASDIPSLSASYITTDTTNQTKSGNLTLTGNVSLGKNTPSAGNIETASSFSAKGRASYMTGVNIVSGAQDIFYCAHLNTDLWKISARYGASTDWTNSSKDLYDGKGSTGLYFSIATYPISDSNPLVIQICSGDDTNGYKFVDHTDVMLCMLHNHTFATNNCFLTKYKIEVLGKAGYDSTAILPASALTWYTIINKSDAHDDIEGLTFKPDNSSVTGTSYISFRGLRITIYGVIGTSDNYFRISSLQMLNQRGAGTPASAVGALPISGGTVYSSITIPTANGSFIGNLTGTADKATKDADGNTISTTYLKAHQSIKTLNTNNTTAQTASSSEAIAGSGTINLHKVSKTGSYNDLLNKPTIPTVNNATLTIQQNGTTVTTFSANASSAATANIATTVVKFRDWSAS